MPEKILREPNDKEFQKRIDDLKADNEKKKKKVLMNKLKKEDKKEWE